MSAINATSETIVHLCEQRDKSLRQCQASGRKGNFTATQVKAEEAITVIEKLRNEHDVATCPSIEASAFGYKGYALFKQGQYLPAITYLHQSQKLSQQNTTILDNTTTSNNSNDDNNNQQRHKTRPKQAAAVDLALRECYINLGDAAPLPPLVKFPRTTHLFDSGGTAMTSDDLVLPNLNALVSTFCDGETNITIEEKIDGANLGISACPYTGKLLVQNRSHYISKGDHAQFSRITEWLEENRPNLSALLNGGNIILFGEWMVARHSIPYIHLPGLFVAFDIYDKTEQKFYSRPRFHATMQQTRIPVVPVIQRRTFGPYTPSTVQDFRNELIELLETRSVFRGDNGPVEGIVLRLDDASQPRSWLSDRFKVVRPDFVQGCSDGHWMTRKIDKQTVDYEFALEYLEGCYVFANEHEGN